MNSIEKVQFSKLDALAGIYKSQTGESPAPPPRPPVQKLALFFRGERPHLRGNLSGENFTPQTPLN